VGVSRLLFCLRFGVPRAGHFHVNVVQVYGYCVVDGREGIVMELCHGDLSEHLWRLTRGPAGFPVAPMAIYVWVQVCGRACRATCQYWQHVCCDGWMVLVP
jgi:hypothetical protein